MPIVAIICSFIFIPWVIVKAWLAPLPDNIQEQVDNALDFKIDGITVHVDKKVKAPSIYTSGWKNINNITLKMLLQQRSGIPDWIPFYLDCLMSINDELKNICLIEHSSHRFFGNFSTNLVCGLLAYSLEPLTTSFSLSRRQLPG